MKTKDMLTEMLYRSGVEKMSLKAEITALKMVHVSDRKKIAGLEEGREPDSETVSFVIKFVTGKNRKLAAIAILRRISGISLKEAKELIDAAWEE